MPVRKARSPMYCSSCGGQVADSFKFCGSCGVEQASVPKSDRTTPTVQKPDGGEVTILWLKLVLAILGIGSSVAVMILMFAIL
jgi:hypothetical protein